MRLVEDRVIAIRVVLESSYHSLRGQWAGFHTRQTAAEKSNTHAELTSQGRSGWKRADVLKLIAAEVS